MKLENRQAGLCSVCMTVTRHGALCRSLSQSTCQQTKFPRHTAPQTATAPEKERETPICFRNVLLISLEGRLHVSRSRVVGKFCQTGYGRLVYSPIAFHRQRHFNSLPYVFIVISNASEEKDVVQVLISAGMTKCWEIANSAKTKKKALEENTLTWSEKLRGNWPIIPL